MLGLFIFGGRLNKDDELYPIYNFDSFLVAFINVTNILTLDNWSNFTKICFKSNINMLIPSIYSFLWIIIGNIFLLNVFLAILLDGFTTKLYLSNKKENKYIDEELRKTQKKYDDSYYFFLFFKNFLQNLKKKYIIKSKF